MNTQPIDHDRNGLDRETIEYEVKQVIVETLNLGIAPEEIGTEDQLFGGGVGLNSMATIEIIVGIEQVFDIEVPDEDLRVELFDSVKTMSDYVCSVIGEDVT